MRRASLRLVVANRQEAEQALTALLRVKCPNTRRRIQAVWKLWLQHCEERGIDWSEAREIDILAFINGYATRPAAQNRNRPGHYETIGARTTRNAATMLHSIYNDLYSVGVCAKDPAGPVLRSLPKPKDEARRRADALSFNQVKTLVDSPPEHTQKGRCLRAGLALLFGAGVRAGEVLNLAIGDVVGVPGGVSYVRLRGTKNGEAADQPLPDWAAERVLSLAEHRRIEGGQPGDALLVEYYHSGQVRGPYSYRTFLRHFREAAQAAGCPPSITPHSGRATAITKLFSEGAGIDEIMAFSRHKSPAMPLSYNRRGSGLAAGVVNKISWH